MFLVENIAANFCHVVISCWRGGNTTLRLHENSTHAFRVGGAKTRHMLLVLAGRNWTHAFRVNGSKFDFSCWWDRNCTHAFRVGGAKAQHILFVLAGRKLDTVLQKSKF